MENLREKLHCLKSRMETLIIIKRSCEKRLREYRKYRSMKRQKRFSHIRTEIDEMIRDTKKEVMDKRREIKATKKEIDSTEFMLGDKTIPYLNRIERIENRIRERMLSETDDDEDDDDEVIDSKDLLFTFKPRIPFKKVILPDHTKDQIFSVLAQIRNSTKIFNTWGLKDTIHYGRGTILLFTGPPGTGKTLATEAIARKLRKRVSMVNYSQLHNKWKGNTEKYVSKIFKNIKNNNNVLVFDEADAVISHRCDFDYSDSCNDNSVKSHFLHELENFEGIMIMTTNIASALDKALERRVSMSVKFEMPGYEQRLEIWKVLVGKKMPLSKDVNFEKLAKKYNFSGGHIKNSVLGAARIAVMEDSRKVKMKHFEKAAEQALKGQSILQQSSLSKNEKQDYFG